MSYVDKKDEEEKDAKLTNPLKAIFEEDTQIEAPEDVIKTDTDEKRKSAFKKAENPCICPPGFPVCTCGQVSKGMVISKKPILPGEQELEENSRSKSAKLRVFERA